MELHIENDNLKALLTSKTMEFKSELSQEEIVKKSLRNPIGSKPLCELAKGKKYITIVTSDHTRPMPSKITLPLLIAEIESINPHANISILVATGLHNAPSEKDQIRMFGEDILNTKKIIIHDAYDDNSIISICQLPSGASFEVNKHAIETNLLVAEGFIEPHFFAGFSGGRKSILPGICSKTSINENHCARLVSHPMSRSGALNGNIINDDMIFAARKVNLSFILNVTLNSNNKIIGAFSGDMELAHKKGCEFVEKYSKVNAVKGDIVITSNGGFPLDQNLYQCAKSAKTASECIKENGVIIIVASCINGIGGIKFKELMTMGKPQEIYDKIINTTSKESIPEQWCAQIFSQILLNHKIIICSNYLDHDLIRKVNMIPALDPNEALEIAFKIKGIAAHVVVIPDGISVIPSN